MQNGGERETERWGRELNSEKKRVEMRGRGKRERE